MSAGDFTCSTSIGGDMAGRAPGGTIIVEKQTDPDGSTQSFEFEPELGFEFLTDRRPAGDLCRSDAHRGSRRRALLGNRDRPGRVGPDLRGLQ